MFNLFIIHFVYGFCQIKFSDPNLVPVYVESINYLTSLLEHYNAHLSICTDNALINDTTQHKVYQLMIARQSIRYLNLNQPYGGLHYLLAKVGGFTIIGVPTPSEEYEEIKQSVEKVLKLFFRIRTLDEEIDFCVERSPILSRLNRDHGGYQRAFQDSNDMFASSNVTWDVD